MTFQTTPGTIDHMLGLVRHDGGDRLAARIPGDPDGREAALRALVDRAGARWALLGADLPLAGAMHDLLAGVEDPVEVCLRRTADGVLVTVDGRPTTGPVLLAA